MASSGKKTKGYSFIGTQCIYIYVYIEGSGHKGSKPVFANFLKNRVKDFSTLIHYFIFCIDAMRNIFIPSIRFVLPFLMVMRKIMK